jgi:hypothetical protein
VLPQTEPLTSVEPRLEAADHKEDDFNDLTLRPYFREFSPHDQIDPFNQLPVQISSQIHAVLQHALKVYKYSGNNYKLAYLPDQIKDNIDQFPIGDVVQKSLAKPHHLYSILACVSIRMQKIFHEAMEGQAPVVFQNHASHHLRKELIRSSTTGEVDKHMLLDILFLVVSETATGDYESARKHLKVVAGLYNLLDTRQHFDFWISETCAHVDNQLALASGTSLVMPQDFDPGPLLPERRAALHRQLHWLYRNAWQPPSAYPSPLSSTVKAATGGPGRDAIAGLAKTMDLRMASMFEHSLRIGLFTKALTPVVADIIECVNIAKVVWLSPMAMCFDAEWLCRKARATLRQLIRMAPENNIGPLGFLDKCMEVVRCTLMIVMSHACTVTGFQTAKRNALKLHQALAFALKHWAPALGLTSELTRIDDREFPPILTEQLEHILFNSVIGLFSADHEGFEATQEFFMSKILNLCDLLEIWNYDALKELITQFFYSPVLLEPSLQKITTQMNLKYRLRISALV